MASARAMACAATVVAGVLAVPLLLGLTYAGGDFARSDMGYLCELKRQLSAGGLWLAPHLGNGQPMFADPQFQLLYPPRWIAAVFAPDLGASVGAVLQLALGAAGAAWLLRSYGVRAFGAACLGIAYAFSGTALNLMWHAAYLSGAAWLPWAWAAGRRILQGSSSPMVSAAFFASLALLLLGGEPQSFAVAGGALAIEAALRFSRAGARRSLLRALLQIGLLLAAAVAVGLAQWLPAAAELALTPRSGTLDVREVLRWSFSAPQWLAALVPGILAERVAPGTSLWLLWYGPGALAPWNLSPYFGPLLVVGAALGFRHRRAWPACAVALLALFISLGDSLPLLPALLRLVPALAVFRYPSKLLLPATLAAAVCSGVALQELTRRQSTERRPFFIVGGSFAAAMTLGAILTLVFRSEINAWAAAAPSPSSVGVLPSLSAVLFQSTVQAVAPLCAALALVLLRPALAKGVPLLLCADLLLAAPTAVSVGPRLDAVVSPFTALDEPGRDLVLCHSGEVFKVTVRAKEESGPWSESLTMRALAAPNLNACDGVTAGLAYSVVQTRINARLELALITRSGAAARALGCTHLVAPSAPADEAGKLVPLRVAGPFIHITELTDPIPGAFLSEHPRLVSTEAQLIDLLLAAHSSAAVVSLIDDPLGRLGSMELPLGAPGAVERLEELSPSKFRLELRGTGSAVAGLRTSFQAGWHATQAGRELPVVRAAGAHVAVVVEHLAQGPIDLEYRPPGMAAGVLAAVLGVLLAVFAIIGPLRRKR